MANTSPPHREIKSYTRGMKIGHLAILNAVQDIEDIIRALIESAGRLFRATKQHIQNISDNQSKK